MPHVIVGTAGHIDHGKTALVKALTGIDADRLKEEKERGITIDIGFAHLALDSDTRIGFIDVPGHERFIKNMLRMRIGRERITPKTSRLRLRTNSCCLRLLRSST